MPNLVLTSPHQLEWRSEPVPVLAHPSSALVRPIAVATCDFDHLLVSGRFGAASAFPIGHECVAQVVEVGSGVTRVRPGDRVIVPFQISCGACAACRRGQSSACSQVPWLACYGLGEPAGNYGGLASDVVLVPYADAMLVPLPPSLKPEAAAAIGCNIVDAYRCVVPQLQAQPSASVLIVSGAFANIALYAVALAKAVSPDSRVHFYDPRPAVGLRAARLGADVLESPRALDGLRCEIAVDASMDRDLLAALIRATARGGVCTASTMYAETLTALPLLTMFERCMTFQTGQPHARALIEPVLALIAAGKFDPAVITDEVVPWHDAQRAFAAGSGKRVCVRE
jgi:threonine dehydrogenase-like Zn-dependent dehydrogenase